MLNDSLADYPVPRVFYRSLAKMFALVALSLYSSLDDFMQHLLQLGTLPY